MGTILGLRGTGNFGTPGVDTSERPKNWRQYLLLLFPNGEAPLTALLSKMKNQPTDDPEFNWWEKGLPLQRTTFTAAFGAAAVAVTVADASIFKKNHVCLNENSNEIMFVTSDPATGVDLVISRGKGEVAAAAIVNADPILIIGTVHEEGDDLDSIIAYSATKQFNYSQIFRTTLGQTRTAKKTRLRWDKTGPYREAKREALQLHGIQMEQAFIWGQRKEEVGPNGFPRRTTRGFRKWVSTNILTDSDADGVWGNQDFDTNFESAFRYGSSEKLALAGSTAISVLTQWAKARSVMNLVPTDQTYGMKLVHILTPFGDLYLKNHPLMSDHVTYRKDMLVMDVEKLNFRYIDDTTFLKNRQGTGVDATKDEYLTEAGLEMHHEKAHSVWKNLNFYNAPG